MVRIPRAVVPSFFTVGNMFLGYLSVIYSLEGKFELAAWMIFAAGFMDAVDGKVARFTNASSKFGVEYDSLADVISFGFAPTFLIYMLYLTQLEIVGKMISFMPLLFGSIRLARFNANLKGFDKAYFVGLPIPVAALTIASFVLFPIQQFGDEAFFQRMLLVVVFVVSVLMVSTVRYETIPNLSLKGSNKDKRKILFLAVVAVIMVIFPKETIFPFTTLYIVYGLVASVVRLFRPATETEKDAKNES
jgi:CDP-diacylglycerol--serine O-phosphatidyltransferase